jgi:hypothetical protein
MWQLVRVVRLSRLSAGLDGMEQSTKTYITYQLLHIAYTLLLRDDGLLASLKHVEV